MTRLSLTFAALCYLVLIALAIRPPFDLDAAAAFYAGGGHFIGDTTLGVVARYVFWACPFLTYLAIVLAALLARCGLVASRWTPNGRGILFLTLSLAIGPGLLVEGTLKTISHRPRPSAISVFGGPEPFQPFYRLDGPCRSHCAFPSGETAAATWTLAPASLAPPPWRGPALAMALVLAIATGLLRMAFGAHFLSDVCGAALITTLVVLAARAMLVRAPPPP